MTIAERTHTPLLTIGDVAERCNVSVSTARRLVANGSIPTHRIGGQLRFERDDVEQWITDNRNDPGSDQ